MSVPLLLLRLAEVDPLCIDKIEVDENGCWLWTGALYRKGYAKILRKVVPGYPDHGRAWRGHRYIYIKLVGPIPDGMVLDHLCRVRRCVNPDHLRVCTNFENLTAPGSQAAAGFQFTHCKQGHEFTEETTFWDRTGRRSCRICRREYDRRRWKTRGPAQNAARAAKRRAT